MKRHAFIALLLVFAASTLLAATAGSVRGKILGPDNRPLSGVVVTLRNDITGFKADSATGTDGTFSFTNVPFNPYEIHVDVQGFAAEHRAVDVRSAIPVEVTIPLKVAAVSESINVTAEPPSAQLETDTSESHTTPIPTWIAASRTDFRKTTSVTPTNCGRNAR